MLNNSPNTSAAGSNPCNHRTLVCLETFVDSEASECSEGESPRAGNVCTPGRIKSASARAEYQERLDREADAANAQAARAEQLPRALPLAMVDAMVPQTQPQCMLPRSNLISVNAGKIPMTREEIAPVGESAGAALTPYVEAWRNVAANTSLPMGDPSKDTPPPSSVHWIVAATKRGAPTVAPTSAVKKAKPDQKAGGAEITGFRRIGAGKGVKKANSATAPPIVPSRAPAPPVSAHVPQPVNDTNPNCATANDMVHRSTFKSTTTANVTSCAPAPHVPAPVFDHNLNCVAVNVVFRRPTFTNPLFRVFNVQSPFVHSVYMSNAVVDTLGAHANLLDLNLRVLHAEETAENIAVLTALDNATLNEQAPCITRIVTISITL
jgi:hypothetical protein